MRRKDSPRRIAAKSVFCGVLQARAFVGDGRKTARKFTNGGSGQRMTAGQSTLREYLAVLRRRKWVVISAVVIVPVIAVAVSELQSPRYSATAAVVLSRQNLSSSLNGVVDPTYTVDPQRLTGTQAQVARAPAVAAAVVNAAGL